MRLPLPSSRAPDLFAWPCVYMPRFLPLNLHPSGRPWETPERGARGAGAFIPIQVATIQYRIYGALTLSRQEGTARLMG